MVPLLEEAHFFFNVITATCITTATHFFLWRGLFDVPATMEVKYSLVFVGGFLSIPSISVAWAWMRTAVDRAAGTIAC